MNRIDQTETLPELLKIWLPTLAFCVLAGAWLFGVSPLLDFLPFVPQSPSIWFAIKAAGFALMSMLFQLQIKTVII